MKVFDDKDAEETDLDYQAQYYPEASSPATVLPFTLASRASIDLGDIRLRKVPLYRVRVKTGGACTPEQTVKIEGSPASVEVACGGEILIRNVQPGKYSLFGRVGFAPPDMVMARQDFEITDGNREITLSLARGADLAGRVIAAQGADKIPLDSLKFRIMPIPYASTLIDPRTLSPDADGKFRFENAPPGRRQLQVIGLTDQFYVKQIRFNGAPVASAMFDFAGAASLEIEIDSQPAALTGTVTNRDKPVPGADLMLLRRDDPEFLRHFTADDNGAFRILGLAPGEYRYFAVSASARERAAEPSAWAGLLAEAEKVVLSRGAAQTVNVKVGEPR